MLKKDITYTDFDGKSVTEPHYFHLNKADLTKIELRYKGGLEAALRRVVEAENGQEIMDMFEFMIKESYGVRSEDGRRFIKTQEVWDNFRQTDAYSELFFELVSDAQAAAAFVRGVVPANLAEQVEANMKAVGHLQTEDVPLSDEPEVQNVFDNGQPEPVERVISKDAPPWIREGRLPTQTELATMTPAQIREAYADQRAQRVDG